MMTRLFILLFIFGISSMWLLRYYSVIPKQYEKWIYLILFSPLILIHITPIPAMMSSILTPLLVGMIAGEYLWPSLLQRKAKWDAFWADKSSVEEKKDEETDLQKDQDDNKPKSKRKKLRR